MFLAARTIDVPGAIRSNGQKGNENANRGFSHGSGSGGGGAGVEGRIRVDHDRVNGTAYPGGAAIVTSPGAFLGSGT